MDALPSVTLVDRLQSVAARWCGSQDPPATLARLGKQVAGDGAFFDRVGAVRGPTTTTLEKFAAFFVDPASWPGGDVPEEALQFGHAVGVSPGAVGAARGKIGGDTPNLEDAA